MSEVSPFDSRAFRDVLGRFPTGVAVVAATHEGASGGVSIGSFFSISLEPPLVGFCIGSSSASWALIRTAGSFVVNILSDGQQELSNRFASKDADKFAGLEWQPAESGRGPRIAGCLGYLDCDIDQVVPAGDHDIVVGRVAALELGVSGGDPLVFFGGRYHTASALG